VDFIVELARVTDKTVSKDELLSDLSEDEPGRPMSMIMTMITMNRGMCTVRI